MFGSIFAKADSITFETADNARVTVSSNFEKIGLRAIGIPHIGLRLRARKMFRLLKLKRGDLILDAGCGSGVHALTLADKGHALTGIDIDKKKIQQAKGLARKLKLKVDFQYGDLTNLKLKKKFDQIICSDVIEHVKDDAAVIRSLSKVCKKGGVLILTAPAINNYNTQHMKEYGHVKAGYSELELETLLRNGNFKIKKIIGYSTLFSRFAWEISRKFMRNKMLAALTFCPLYALTFIEDFILNSIKKKYSDGLLVVATK